MAWSWPAWLVSVGAVAVSGALAWREGNWKKRADLAMGFANHGGMWSDLILLSAANAVIVPHLRFGGWLIGAITLSAIASVLVHMHWYGHRPADANLDQRGSNHMWPRRARGTWWRDLSWSGWAHVFYVIGELALLAGFLIHDVAGNAVLLVAIIFTIHVPIGLLQPRYFLTGHIATAAEQPLLIPCLGALWAVIAYKWP
jgi:hypothetical protein